MMDGLKMIPYIVLVLAVTGIIIGAASIVLSKFTETTTDANALNALHNSTKGVNTVAEQQPTVAIIAVMVIVISIIAGVFTYFRYFG